MSVITSHQRIIALDVLRTVAIIGTIIIHTLHPVFARPDFVGGISWWLANILYTFARMAIPLFIMISGYLILPKAEPHSLLLKRVAYRLLIPLTFWYLFYSWWNWWFLHYTWSWRSFYQSIYSGDMLLLYFLVILAGLYVISPFITTFVTSKSICARSILKASLWIMGIASLACTYAFFLMEGQGIWNVFTAWLPYLGYFLFGYALALLGPPHKHKLILLLALILVFTVQLVLNQLLVTEIGTSLDIFWLNQSELFFGLYLSPTVILQSTLFFSIILSLEKTLRRFWSPFLSIFSIVATCSFGMYLTHAIVINILDQKFGYDILQIQGDLWHYILVKLSFVSLGSLLLTLLLLYIPLLRIVLGVPASLKKL